MKKLLVLSIFCFLYTAETNATNVRGYVEKYFNDQCNASPGDSVVIYFQGEDKYWAPKAGAQTDQDGFFFFYSLEPGDYKICVNNLHWFDINVKKAKWQDLPIFRYKE